MAVPGLQHAAERLTLPDAYAREKRLDTTGAAGAHSGARSCSTGSESVLVIETLDLQVQSHDLYSLVCSRVRGTAEQKPGSASNEQQAATGRHIAGLELSLCFHLRSSKYAWYLLGGHVRGVAACNSTRLSGKLST